MPKYEILSEPFREDVSNLLCIGGPLDGDWHIAHPKQIELRVAVRRETTIDGWAQAMRSPGAVVPARQVRYRRALLWMANTGPTIACWVLDGMSDFEAIDQLLRGYQRPHPRNILRDFPGGEV